MILTDIYVCSLDAAFDFLLDDQEQIGKVIQSVLSVLEKKLGTDGKVPGAFRADREDGASAWMLCDLEGERILQPEYTLAQYKIRDGGRLLLG